MAEAVLMLVLMLPLATLAKDFGKAGSTFEVKEEGFLEMIYRKLRLLDIEKEQQKMQKTVVKKVETPNPVVGVEKATKNRSFTYDPTYTLEEDIYLPDGKVLHAKGTKINPLDQISMTKRLVFIDARDGEQIDWLKKQASSGNFRENDKLILVAGRPFEIGKELGREVYFDQLGLLTTKFGIKAVPAVVEQEKPEDRVLKVSEVGFEDNKERVERVRKW
jgi:conjugal transfer pilus assembly protein TraW